MNETNQNHSVCKPDSGNDLVPCAVIVAGTFAASAAAVAAPLLLAAASLGFVVFAVANGGDKSGADGGDGSMAGVS